MKKLLTIFGAIGLLSSISSSVVSCGKSEDADWFSLPAYPTNDDELKTSALNLYTKFTKYKTDFMAEWTKDNSSDSEPSDDWIKSNDNAQKGLVYMFTALGAFGYILQVMDSGETTSLVLTNDENGDPVTVDAMSKDDLDKNTAVDGLPSTVGDSYKTYYTQIATWAEAYSKS